MAPVQSEYGSGNKFDDLRATIQTASREIRRTIWRTALLRSSWQWLVLLAAAFVLDLAFGLPVLLRWIVLSVLVGFASSSAYAVVRDERKFIRSDEWAARVIEERFPDADSALINGVQFERILAGGTGEQPPADQYLMRLAVERALRTTSRIGDATAMVDRGPEQRAARMLAVIAVAWLLTAVLFPAGFMAVMPRLFAPWCDESTPPWSPTNFDVEPRGAQVRLGDRLDISVATSGQMPANVDLMLRARGKSDWQRLDMSGDQPGKWLTTLDSLSEDSQYYVQANTGRSATYWIQVALPPVVTGLTATYLPPKYTNRPAFQEIVGASGIHGLLGTAVTLNISSNRALSQSILHILFPSNSAQSEQQVAVTPAKGADDNEATVQFTIDRPGYFRLDLTASDGQQKADAAHGNIVLDINQRPNVWIPQPGHNLLVTPAMTIPVRVEAQDENALSSIVLHRSINQIDDSPLTYGLTALPKDQIETSTFDLPDLGVQAGDVITYYAEAYDNQPGIPNIGVSETYTLTVVTQEQFQKALQQARTPSRIDSEAEDMVTAAQQLAQDQQALAAHMIQVANELKKHPGDSGLKSEMRTLEKQQAQLEQRANALAKQMSDYAHSPSGSSFEQALKAKVAEAAARIAQAAKAMQQASGSGIPSEEAAAAETAANQLAQASNQVQNQVRRAAQQMMKMWPLYHDVERFFALVTAQGELVLRARQFEDQDDESPSGRAKMAELSNEQEQIDHALQQLQSDFRVDADQAQDEFPHAAASARRIASEIDQRHIPPLMSSARDAFRRGDGSLGFQCSSEALTEMQSMISECHGAQSGQEKELSDSLSLTLGKSSLGQSLGQMAGSGFGVENGIGGMGIGGIDSGLNGMPGGSEPTSDENSPQPYTPQTDFLNGTGGPDKMSHRNSIAGAVAPLSANDIEMTGARGLAPPKAGSQDTASFPAQYRKLIADYYRSVANGQ